MKTPQPESFGIQWYQIVSLVALDVAIIISWIAYHEYQPKLLEQFRFTELSLALAIVQGIVLFLTPPIAGWFADKMRRAGKERLPVVNIGISTVSMIFMAVAATIFANPQGTIRLLFPFMIVFWLISMNIFHSPAISTLELFVPKDKLPRVMAIFTLIADIAQSIEPSIVDLINFFGAPITFFVGGALVFSTGWWFKKTTTRWMKVHITQEAEDVHGVPSSSNFLNVFLIGIGLGVATVFFFSIFPDWAEERLTFLQDWNWKSSYFVSLLIAFAALIGLPISAFVEKQGVLRTSIIGLISCIALVIC
ncbi:MAG: hypothetical protein NZ521_12105, partial [Flammeovirgaceae bacterium]|nr:hypothetical protein [Flammeovirgaceae bacterium]MDW8288070.1 hypothetical protein [Flammeovirgaceae bacterium]